MAQLLTSSKRTRPTCLATSLQVCLATIAALIFPAASIAQISVPQVYFTTFASDQVVASIAKNSINSVREVVKPEEVASKSGANGRALSSLKGTGATSTIAPSSGRPVAPAKLAALYPPANRTQVEQAFTEALSGYRQIESRFGLKRNDLAGAVAAFIAGSYMAYHDVDFPDEDFKPLADQMRQAMSSRPELAQVSAQEKQETYEQLAILGTTMALTREALKSQPNAKLQADMRKAAKGYLEQLLKTDADQVKLTSAGLSFN